jgi:hypothetical protein
VPENRDGGFKGRSLFIKETGSKGSIFTANKIDFERFAKWEKITLME